MRKRKWMLLLAVVTAVGSFLLKVHMTERTGRYHQHMYAETVADAGSERTKECIHPTEEAQYHYDADAVDTEELMTHLPLVVIRTNEVIPGKPYYTEDASRTYYTMANDGQTTVMGEMQIMDRKGKLHRLSDEPDLRSNIRIRVRGNSSRWFDKSSYAIKTVTQDEKVRNVEVMGMEKHHDWALHGPFLDKSLVRNYVGMNLSGMLMDYAPDVRFCEAVINGEYKGVYVMMETPAAGEGRADISGVNSQKNMTGYIIQFDVQKHRQVEQLYHFSKYSYNLKESSYVRLEYPGKKALKPEILDFVEKDLSRFEKALYSYDYDTVQYGFQNYVDLKEFADYMIIAELFEQQDTGKLSTFYYKDINGLFQPCVWDFNNCSDNFSVNTTDDFHIRQFITVQAPWFYMMVKEESFVNYVIQRYHALRKDVLTDSFIEGYIDGTVAYLGTAADRNWAVWGYSFDTGNLTYSNKLSPKERNPQSYDAAVEQFKSALLERAHWLDENIEILKQYAHESAVKKFNH